MSKNLGKSLTETLNEQATNFSKWQSASQAILNGCKSLKKMSDSVEEVNDSLVGLEKQKQKENLLLYIVGDCFSTTGSQWNNMEYPNCYSDYNNSK